MEQYSKPTSLQARMREAERQELIEYRKQPLTEDKYTDTQKAVKEVGAERRKVRAQLEKLDAKYDKLLERMDKIIKHKIR